MTDLATVLTRAGIEPNPEMEMTASLTQAGMETAVPIALDCLFPDPDGTEFLDVDHRRIALFFILQEEVKTGVEAALLNARLDPEGLEWHHFLTTMEAAGWKAARRFETETVLHGVAWHAFSTSMKAAGMK